MARVVLTATAAEAFDGLPLTMKARVLLLFERLERWPAVSGVKPLRGPLTGRYRMRTGDWRVQFRVRGDQVVVEQVGHRDGFYEDRT